MRSKSEILSMLLNPGVIPVLRLKGPDQILPVAEALFAGGARAIEITVTTPGAIAAVGRIREAFGQKIVAGVGSVLDIETCQAAIEAGAEFIVTPITRKEIVLTAHAADRPIMLGAYTPTEAQTAYEAGADLIKIFPANTLGPGFIKALLTPLPHLRIVPTGGIDLQNIAQFFQAGSVAVGIGSTLISENLLAEHAWPRLTETMREYVSAASHPLPA